jgi:hypothetical protein
MIAILWILVAPNVDLDPATPLNLEVFFFLVIAIYFVLDIREYVRNFLRSVAARSLEEPAGSGSYRCSQSNPLRC